MKKIRLGLMSYVLDNRPAKGSALCARKLIEQLVKDDRFEVSLIHFDKVDDSVYSHPNVKEVLIPKIGIPWGSRFVSLMWYFYMQRKNKFDIIHWFQPRMYPFFWYAPAHHKMVTAHGGGDVTAPTKGFSFSRSVFNFILKQFNNRLDFIIAGSKFGRQEIIDAYGTDPKKTVYTYYGGGEEYQLLDKVDAQKLVFEKYAIRSPYIVDVARLVPHKNIDGVIKAYIYMRTTTPERKEKLVIVGTKAMDTTEIDQMIAASEFKSDIQFVEYVEVADLNAIYSAAELFVFPSHNEGFGLPVIEAMASGIPVITSTTTSLPEVGGDAAVLVDPTSIEEISTAMTKLLSDPAMRADCIEKGKAHASHFTWEQNAEETKKIYFAILNHHE